MTTTNILGLLIVAALSIPTVGWILLRTIFKRGEIMKEKNDLNTVEIRGTLDRDVELRYTSNGTPVINLALMYTFRYNEKEKVSRFDVVQFGPAAEDLNQELKKGTVVEVYGRLEVASWEDREGNLRSKVQIVARSIDIIDP